MPSTVSSKGESSFELIPPGTHYAVCTRVLNLGDQPSNFGPKPKHFIGFDVPAVRVEWEKDGVKTEGPGFIGGRYTSSLSPKAILRQHLEAWRGAAFTEEQLAGFDLFSLLGVSAMISVTHTEDGKYANISAIMGMPPGTDKIAPESELLGYDPSSPDANEVFAKLPEGFQKAIQRGQQPAPAAPAPPPIPGHQVAGAGMGPAAPPIGAAGPGAAHPIPGHQAAGQGQMPRAPALTPGANDFDDDIPFS